MALLSDMFRLCASADLGSFEDQDQGHPMPLSTAAQARSILMVMLGDSDGQLLNQYRDLFLTDPQGFREAAKRRMAVVMCELQAKHE